MTPHTARPDPIATTSVCKMLIADVKNAIFNPETQIQNERNNTVLHNKKPPVSTDGTPFWLGYPFLFIFCFIFDGLYNGLFPALPRLRPDRRQKIFFCNKSHSPPFPTLRHGVANFSCSLTKQKPPFQYKSGNASDPHI